MLLSQGPLLVQLQHHLIEEKISTLSNTNNNCLFFLLLAPKKKRAKLKLYCIAGRDEARAKSHRNTIGRLSNSTLLKKQ